MFHAVAVRCGLHFDAITGNRFHPIDIFLWLGIKLVAIVAFGPPVLAFCVFEIVLHASSLSGLLMAAVDRDDP
ncbi:MAG: hypothetical protein OES09_00525 [Gammaproteobacteria bacterium]|nr:hypothetical protein [Gammaproteobacteria bacterium]